MAHQPDYNSSGTGVLASFVSSLRGKRQQDKQDVVESSASRTSEPPWTVLSDLPPMKTDREEPAAPAPADLPVVADEPVGASAPVTADTPSIVDDAPSDPPSAQPSLSVMVDDLLQALAEDEPATPAAEDAAPIAVPEEIELPENEAQPEFGDVVFRNDAYTLRYSGPAPQAGMRVAMTFPDLIHPTEDGADGWGRPFLAKRGIPVLSLTYREANWYQSEQFFPAIDAARDFLGPDVSVTTYGASMAAMARSWAARRLGADRVVALCPQFTIEPEIAPFERRYRAEAERIGPFIHDISAELSDEIDYFVIIDPSHGIDTSHVKLFPKPHAGTRPSARGPGMAWSWSWPKPARQVFWPN